MIRAKISGEKIVSPSNSSSPYMKMIQYEIKMIKVGTVDSRDAAPAADLLGLMRILTGPSRKKQNKTDCTNKL